MSSVTKICANFVNKRNIKRTFIVVKLSTSVYLGKTEQVIIATTATNHPQKGCTAVSNKSVLLMCAKSVRILR